MHERVSAQSRNMSSCSRRTLQHQPLLRGEHHDTNSLYVGPQAKKEREKKKKKKEKESRRVPVSRKKLQGPVLLESGSDSGQVSASGGNNGGKAAEISSNVNVTLTLHPRWPDTYLRRSAVTGR
jgi:hypothetical protein